MSFPSHNVFFLTSCWMERFWPLSSWLPTATQWGPGPVSVAAQDPFPGALAPLRGWRAPHTHGFFICGSHRINVLFLPSQTGTMDQHFLSPLLISCVFGCLCACEPMCVYVFLIFHKLSQPCLLFGNHILCCFIFLLFSLVALLYHAWTWSPGSLTMRLILNLGFSQT